MPGPGFGDLQSGTALAGGIGAALFQRERTGKGTIVDVSLMSAGLWAMGMTVSGASVLDADELPAADRTETANPLTNVYRTKDGAFIALGFLQADRYWPEFCIVVDKLDWVLDERFATMQARGENSVACVALLDELFAERTLAEWEDLLSRQQGQWDVFLQAGRVRYDEQVQANEFAQLVEHDGDGKVVLVPAPAQFGGEVNRLGRGPALGADTDALFSAIWGTTPTGWPTCASVGSSGDPPINHDEEEPQHTLGGLSVSVTENRSPQVQASINGAAPAMTHWEMIDALREEHRFFWNDEEQGYWVLTRYEDIREAFQTPEVFCNHSIIATNPDPEFRFLPSFSDPPIHMAYRRPMNPWFAPGAINKLEPRLRELARAEVERVLADGRCDYMSTFGDRFPVAGFLASMGLPMDDADFFVSIVHRMSGATGGDAYAVEQMGAAWGELAQYWAEMLADRRKNPLDPSVDFVTMMSRSKLNDDPMPDQDILDIMVTLTLGSLDTLKSSARLADVAPGHPSRGPRPPDRRPVADPRARWRSSSGRTRSCRWPARSPRTSTSTAAR